MNINETLSYIHSVSWMGSRPGLSRTRELLRLMGDPQNKMRFVHVAGTNGKGSTCSMTASILQAAGYRVGLYTSPYILRFNERMKVDGVDISDFWPRGDGYSYGLGIRIPRRDTARTDFGWGGAAGTYGSIDPENEITIFYAQHFFGGDDGRVHNGIRNIVYAALL